MLGFHTQDEAAAAYAANYASDWQGGKTIGATTIDGFKAWMHGDTTEPFMAPAPATPATDAPAGQASTSADAQRNPSDEGVPTPAQANVDTDTPPPAATTQDPPVTAPGAFDASKLVFKGAHGGLAVAAGLAARVQLALRERPDAYRIVGNGPNDTPPESV